LEQLPVFDSGSIAFAAHALSNFLSVIRGTVELLLLSLKDYPKPEVRIRLEALQHAADLMTHTVSQLMNTSTAVAPRLILDKVDLPLLVRKCCDYYERVAARKQIRVMFTPTETTPAWTDRVAVAAVLDNLLSNAVKYSPPGKRILVEVASEHAHVACCVQDEGSGISAEDQAKLFQRGVRLSAVPTGGEPSTGYGLAVAKALIDKLGGRIWCQSELGQGARFCFLVPTFTTERSGADNERSDAGSAATG